MGLGLRDTSQIKKCAVHLAIRINTSLEFLLNIPIKDLEEILEEVADIGSE